MSIGEVGTAEKIRRLMITITPYVPVIAGIAYLTWVYASYRRLERHSQELRADANARLDKWLESLCDLDGTEAGHDSEPGTD